MTTLYLVRHAHAEWNPDEQRPLSPRGGRDAERVAEVLSDLPLGAFYSSPALRAYDTIVPLAARFGRTITVCDDLQERVLSGEPVDDFVAAVRRTWEEPGFAFPGGESNQAAQTRGVAAAHAVARRHPGESVVVATHGNLLALVLQHYDPPLGWAFWQSLTMPDVYRLTLHNAQPPDIVRCWHE